MSRTVAIREARPGDARAIAEIHVEGWRWGYRDILPGEHLDGLSIDEREAVWLQGLTDPTPGTARFVAVDDGHVVGFVGTGPAEDDFAPPPPDAAEVYAIYLLEEVQGMGVGRALIDRATEAMRANGSEHAVLWVFEANDRARRFYEAAGWAPDGERAEHRFDRGSRPVLRYARDL
jgi:GNAT superfamily N-acetyltransferase